MQRSRPAVDWIVVGEPLAWHLVAHTRNGWRKVVEWPSGIWLWTHLMAHFPDAWACVAMPDHVHLLLRGHGDALRDTLDRILRGHGHRFGTRWDVPVPEPVRTPAIACRTLRYVALNPVRSGDIGDPLAWPWSTLRDLVGATVDPWVDLARLGSLRPVSNTSAEWQRYVLAGAERGSSARPLPRPATDALLFPVGAAREAVASALRSHPERTLERGQTRRLFVQMIRDLRPEVSTAYLARACKTTPRTIRNLALEPDARAIHAAKLCLGDEALRHWTV